MTFREARRCKRAEQLARAHPIAWMLRRVATQTASVHGPATLWLYQLNSVAPDEIKARADWPQTPQQLACIFSELREGLAALGVTLTRKRAKICGTIHRVWRVESVFTLQFSSKSQPLLLSGKTDEITPIEADSAKLSPTKAESALNSSAHTGAPQMPQKRRKTTVEECARVTAHEAHNVGEATAETQIGKSAARRLWAVCPACERRVCYLYRLPSGEQWKCQRCHDLTTRARQERGTVAGFDRWLTFERWERATETHPATAQLYQALADDWRATVEPFNPAQISAERRAELLEFYPHDAAIKRVFERRRDEFRARMEERERQTGALIRAELFADWKRHKHRRGQTPQTATDAPAEGAAMD